MSEITIEKGIPVSAPLRDVKYPERAEAVQAFLNMEVGDSFVVEGKANAQVIRSAIIYHLKKQGLYEKVWVAVKRIPPRNERTELPEYRIWKLSR